METPLRVQAVVFDLDGTLVDSYGAIAECFNHARTSLGEPPLGTDEVRRMVGHGLESLMEQAVGKVRVDEAVRLFRERYDRICTGSTVPLPEVPETLAVLHGRGIRMGVATNKPARFARRILEALELMPPLAAAVGPGPGMPAKPDPSIVRQVLADLATGTSQALYVGDMGVDVATARAAGLPVWVLATGSSSRNELEAAGADGILDRFSDLARLLAGPGGGW
jgi:phosphoglycolate phosphatase